MMKHVRCASWTTALILGSNICAGAMASEPGGAKGRALEDGFVTPPHSAKPQAWWHWLDGKPSPTGRFTFTNSDHYQKDDPLLPSGLFGPVRLDAVVAAPLE